MAEQTGGALSDRRLEAMLAATAAASPYPATPDIAARLRLPSSPRAGTRWLSPSWVAAAVVIVLALAAVVMLTDARSTVAEWFHRIEGQQITFMPTPVPTEAAATTTPRAPFIIPTATPGPPPTAEQTPFPARAMTLAEVTEEVEFTPAVPDGFGAPDAVYLLEYGSQAVAVLQYEAFDLWQTRGPGFFDKGIPAGTILEQVEVGGQPAYWLEGGGRVVVFRDADGEEALGSRRVVDRNTLIWRGVETFYRMETDLELEAALAIAETLP